MPVHNAEIADAFSRVADLLEIEGANPFRVRAYRNAARTIGDLPRSAAAMVADGEDLSKLPAIGKDLAAKIAEMCRTGHLRLLDEIAERMPADLVAIGVIPGLGPKRIKALHDQLGIDTLAELAQAARAGRVRALEGFGARIEQRILAELDRVETIERRMRLCDAEQFAESLLAFLKDLKGVKEAVIAGSYRRRRETVGDIDILVTATSGSNTIDRFAAYDEVARIVSRGSTRSTIVLRGGLQADLRVVPEVSYGAALCYFTGSKVHNIVVRQRGVRRGLKINEYGVFRGSRRIAGRTETDVYEQVGLPFIPPELRENRGEIEAAEKGRLPSLVAAADIKGDLHVHSAASDGRFSVAEMAEAAKVRGYSYIAITDHSKRVTVARGLDAERLARQVDEIDRLNEELKGIRVLKSSEVDILEDGSLDLPDDILDRLDLTICAVHYKFDLASEKQTERIIRAMDNVHFNVLAHPTGRLINERPSYEIDLGRIMEAALQRGCFVELNAHPSRLDIDDVHCKLAKDMGLKVAIGTDAHSIDGLDKIRFGIDQARRGWLEPDDVLNTRAWQDLERLLKR